MRGRLTFRSAVVAMQLCLVWSGTAAQVNPYTVRGEVRDSAQKLAALHVGVAGIYGVVGAMHGYRPMAGATVQVGGANRSAVTDSAGRFFVPIQRPGVYMVRMTQPGYEDHVFPIDIPRDRPVEASRFLDSTDKLPRLGPDGSRQDFDRRLLWRSVNSAPALGSELAQRGGTLAESLRGSGPFASKGFYISWWTCVFVDGVPRPGMPLDGISTDDVEAVELYAPGDEGTGLLVKRWPAGTPCSGSSRMGGRVSGQGAQFVVVWLRHSK